MSGAPTPPRVVEPFAKNAVGPYITLPIPVPSQTGITPGAASYDDGFPPLNMTDPASGGIPPSGADMNGILYTLSAWCAALQAGQAAKFDATAATAFGGYKVGAMLASTTLGLFWYNTLDGNTTNPDVDATDWIGWRPAGSLYLAVVAAAGLSNNVAPVGFNDSVNTMDVDPAAGDSTWSGLAAGAEGQRLVISNTGSTYSLTLLALSGSSTAPNQFRSAADITLLPQMTIQLQYSVGAGKWIVIP